MDNIELKQQIHEKNNRKQLKYHTFFLILFLLLFLFLILLLKIGPDVLPFAMFVLFFSVPIFLLFTSHIKDIIPNRLVNLLTEDVKEVTEIKRKQQFFSSEGRLSSRNKQYVYIFFLLVIGIGLIQLMRGLYVEIDPLSVIYTTPKTKVKLLSGVFLTVFACVITINFYRISTK